MARAGAFRFVTFDKKCHMHCLPDIFMVATQILLAAQELGGGVGGGGVIPVVALLMLNVGFL